jgi:hypothetical protein
MADMKERTVQTIPVSVTQPYATGHKVTEAEARALNQVRAENIANNLRKTLKGMLDDAEGDVESVKKAAQAKIAEYDATYVFTLASVGGGSSSKLSPVEKEARRIARDLINAELAKLGKTAKAYKEEKGDDAINIKVAEIADNPKVVELAKANLASRQGLANTTL